VCQCSRLTPEQGPTSAGSRGGAADGVRARTDSVGAARSVLHPPADRARRAAHPGATRRRAPRVGGRTRFGSRGDALPRHRPHRANGPGADRVPGDAAASADGGRRSDRRDLASRLAGWPPRARSTRVATADGAIAGFVIVVGDEVEQVYVAAAFRGTGVANVLIDAAGAPSQSERPPKGLAGGRHRPCGVVAGRSRSQPVRAVRKCLL
jgi:hypothetical protein